jgi:hypothetical protein
MSNDQSGKRFIASGCIPPDRWQVPPNIPREELPPPEYWATAELLMAVMLQTTTDKIVDEDGLFISSMDRVLTYKYWQHSGKLPPQCDRGENHYPLIALEWLSQDDD